MGQVKRRFQALHVNTKLSALQQHDIIFNWICKNIWNFVNIGLFQAKCGRIRIKRNEGKMDSQQTAANYDKIAQHWASDTFSKENGIAQHARALQFSTTSGRAIDVGCGSSGRIIDLLLAHGFEVEGLDISSEMLAFAKRKHPNVLFHHADICAWRFPKRYDFISAWDSIWHAPLDCHAAIIEKLCAGLNPGGILIFTSGGVDAPGEVTNACHGQSLYHAALGIPQLMRLVDRFGCICRHLEYDQHPELHVYLIVQKPSPIDE